MKSLIAFTILVLSLVSIASKTFQSEGKKLRIEKVAQGLGIPWGMAFLPNSSEVLVTDRNGRLLQVGLKGKPAPFAYRGLPKIYVSGQGGLLDVTLHPNFTKNRMIYLSYSIAQGDKNTLRIGRGVLQGKTIKNWQNIFTARPASSRQLHFGSRLLFDKNGYLFATIGDRGMRPLSQGLGAHNGKIIRIKEDGSIPKDNPYINKKGYLPEIWSFGHRNPQGLAFDSKGQLWSHEHGPRGGDEINLIQAKKNYGWPEITYGREYYGPKIGTTHKKGMEQPVKYYVPSIAPSGMVFYSGKKIPQWKDNLFIGSLVLTHLNRTVLKKGQFVDEERILDDWGQRIRSVQEGLDGFLYFTTDQGEMYRIVPGV